MKQHILDRYSNAVIYECELPDSTENAMRAALVKAVAGRAYLSSANLSGAYLNDAQKLIGSRPYFSISNIGSRQDNLILWLTDKGSFLRTGCFEGTFEEFRSQLATEHGENDHAKEYKAALVMCEVHASIWTPTTEAKE